MVLSGREGGIMGAHKEQHVTESTDDFAAMFEASVKTKRLREGQTVEGRIVSIGPEVAFVDVGGKGEATIEVSELKDGDGDIEVAVGDRIQAMVVSTAGGLQLSRKLARGAATDRQLEDAFRTGLPVEGRVEKAVKGGYEIPSAGSAASVRSPRSTRCAPTRRSTKARSTRSASSSTRTAARIS